MPTKPEQIRAGMSGSSDFAISKMPGGKTLNKNHLVWLRLVGIGLFIALLYEVDWQKLEGIAGCLDWHSMAVIVLGNTLAFILGMLRWVYLLSTQRIYLSPYDGFWIFGASFFLGILTPGRAGEFLRIVPLKWEGHRLGPLSFSVVIERLLDGMIVLMSAGCSIWYLHGERIDLRQGFGATAASFFLGVMLLSASWWWCRRGSKKESARWKKGWFNSWISRLKKTIQSMAESFFVVSWRQWSIIGALSLGVWLVDYSLFYLLARLAAVPISFLDTVIVVSIASLVTTLPISIAGLGTRDLTLIYLFEVLQLPAGHALTFSVFFISTIAGALGLGFLCWLKVPKVISKAQQDT